MYWEDLKVYRPLNKEGLKAAYKEFINIVAENLFHFGFKKIGNKLNKQSEDLIHVIHLDTRGSWMGLTDSFRTEIDIKTIYDKDIFVRKYEPTGSVPIENLIPNIKNHYRITEEYKLLADFLARKIISYVLPYFDKYTSTRKILANREKFQPAKITTRHEMSWNLILYSELANQIDNQASSILKAKIEFYNGLNKDHEVLNDLNFLHTALIKRDWNSIEEMLGDYKGEVFQKIKIK